MAVLEAMAASKPVLVSDFPPMREAVDHMVTGYIARADDPASLADGIRFYSRNLNRLGELGLAGFQKARESFSVERITAEYLGDFQELINLKPASRLCGISSSGTPERSEQP
ncbi:MAG: glycosyltransferase family 4 protein [Bryobacteraceae bacterium]|nr:glycosyltransferase family 4 protein [Bryobacteraceae bacterium]